MDRAPRINDIEFWDSIPPLDPEIPYAPLQVLSYQKLARGDPDESERLFEAAKTLGFFYVDLDNDAGRELLDTVDLLFGVSKKAFDLPLEEKMADVMLVDGKLKPFGYKPIGITAVDKEGTKDNTEHFVIGCSDILGLTDRKTAIYNEVIKSAFGGSLSGFSLESFELCRTILHELSKKLGIDESGPDYLPKLHQHTAKSATHVRFLKYPPRKPEEISKLSLLPHTDFGSLTVLFNTFGGLQVFVPAELNTYGSDAKWMWVKPLRGHATVNIGDTLLRFSGESLISDIHRVLPSPGRQNDWTRYGLAYFCKPNDDVLLRPLKGTRIKQEDEGREVISAYDWMMRRLINTSAVNFAEEKWTDASGTDNKYSALSREM